MKHLLHLFFLLISFTSTAQYGILDGDFDADGILQLDFDNGNDLGSGVLQTADGKVLVCGYAFEGNYNWFVSRFHPDGSIDNTFGVNGTSTLDVNRGNDQCWTMALQGDGKILLGGMTGGGPSPDFTVARFNADGTIDASFGNGGLAIVEISSSHDVIKGMAVQPDGKIVATGITTAGLDVDIATIRLNADGTLDNTFSFDGKVITNVNEDDWGQSVSIAADGKIVIAGSTEIGIGEGNTLLVRYNADGSLDNTFGTNGKVENNLSVSAYDEFYACTVIGSGKILASGASWTGSSTDVLVARFNVDGTFDNTFSFDGMVETDFSGETDRGWDILIQPDSRILVAGESRNGNDRLALVRYNADGSLDNTFGTNGKVTTAFGTDDRLEAITLQSDGKIVGAGYANSSGYDVVVARYLSGMNVGIGDVDAYIGSTLVYPNPITDNSVTVEYELTKPEMVSIDLFDVSGKHVAVLQPKMQQFAGKHAETLLLPQFASGSYILKLTTASGTVSIQITLE